MEEQPTCLELDTGLWLQASPDIYLVVTRSPEDTIKIEMVYKVGEENHAWTLHTIDPKEVRKEIDKWVAQRDLKTKNK